MRLSAYAIYLAVRKEDVPTLCVRPILAPVDRACLTYKRTKALAFFYPSPKSLSGSARGE
jgi:hypothetical protein